MIVTFVSECRKKSIQRTQRILDTYAYRIGRRTWQANLTEQGLEAIRQRLTAEATRGTAVACHRVTARRQTELVWVVGNKRVFDDRGRVAVHRSKKNHTKKYADGMWPHLPLVEALVAMAALWHDFGKAAEPFQRSLREGESCDTLRHEWISLVLLHTFVDGRGDAEWLDDLSNVQQWFHDATREETWVEQSAKSLDISPLSHPGNSPIARWLKWLIVSHHLLPKPVSVAPIPDRAADWNSIAADVDSTWGYHKRGHCDLSNQQIAEAFRFNDGLPTHSSAWRDNVVKTSHALIAELESNVNSRWDHPQEIERVLLVLSRSALMLGDHQFSAQESDKAWRTDYPPFANTRKQSETAGSGSIKGRLKQKLDEHLLGVGKRATRIVRRLPYLHTEMPVLDVPRELRKSSPPHFAWQNKAVDEVRKLVSPRSRDLRDRPGTVIVNTAGTGTGKTTANARILATLNPDSLRVAFTLGLRTLTLQTGDEYRERLKLKRRDMEVIIGSKAVQQLHQSRDDQSIDGENGNALDDHSITGHYESLDVPDEEFFYGEVDPNSEQQRALARLLSNPRDRRLLLAPFLVCTIDHLIPAVDGIRGGRQIMPMLRLMSSDLVIDEIDDYSPGDLIAVLRLVHLAGMMGRDVLISSATITPSICQSVFNAFQSGRESFAAFQNASPQVDVLWTDEFSSKSYAAIDEDKFEHHHKKQMQAKFRKLAKKTPKRRGLIFPVDDTTSSENPSDEQDEQTEQRHNMWVNAMASAVFDAHQHHHQVDPVTKRRVSIGLVRAANIDPCVAIADELISASDLPKDFPNDFEVRVIVYHSRQVLILRSQIERYLGQLLSRRQDRILEDPVIRGILEKSDAKNVVFVVVASPVCEVGRDHDYDWAVAEPSSMRSLIQICGRVLRHREQSPTHANTYVPNLNYRAFVKSNEDAAFVHPGFEQVRVGPVEGRLLQTKMIRDLVDVDAFANGIDARPRILAPEPLNAAARLADLEHAVLNDILLNPSRSSHSPNGWNRGCHYLVGAAQQVTRFRASSPETKLYLGTTDDESLAFFEPGLKGSPGVRASLSIFEVADETFDRLWLPPIDYLALIAVKSAEFSIDPLVAMKRFGELIMPNWLLDDERSVWCAELGAYREQDG